MNLKQLRSKIFSEKVLWSWSHSHISGLFFRVFERKIQRQKADGSWVSGGTFFIFDRGSSVAALLHEVDTDSVILTRQYRAGVDKYVIEMPAGMLENKEKPTKAILREVFEETGYSRYVSLKKLFTLKMSPGGSTDTSHGFYIRVNSTDKTSEGGGLLNEEEFLEVLKIPVKEAISMIYAKGNKEPLITDAKTVVALQWLENRS